MDDISSVSLPKISAVQSGEEGNQYEVTPNQPLVLEEDGVRKVMLVLIRHVDSMFGCISASCF